VFAVPIAERCVVYGQVVGQYRAGGYFFAMFSPCYSKHVQPDLDMMVTGTPDLIALSFDTLIESGDWRVVGRAPVAKDMPLPAFKVMVAPGRFEVVDYSGRRRRPARAGEEQLLPNRVVVSPALVEAALRAKHGLEPWLEEYDDLKPQERAISALMFSSG
jgi:hypothetical protein